MSGALYMRARGPVPSEDRGRSSLSFRCPEPTHLSLASSITAAIASSTAAYSLSVVFSRSTRGIQLVQQVNETLWRTLREIILFPQRHSDFRPDGAERS